MPARDQGEGRSLLCSFDETVTNPAMEMPMSIEVRSRGIQNTRWWTTLAVLSLVEALARHGHFVS